MNKVKFNVNFYDKVDGVYYNASTSFVEVPDHVLARLKQRAEFSKGEYESEEQQPKPAKKPAKPKLSD